MDHDRRLALAAIAATTLGELHLEVTESWTALMPAATAWTAEQRARADAAVSATLQALTVVMVQGDLEERQWERTQRAVHGQGHATLPEVDDLLRTVRVVGVGRLLDTLQRWGGLRPDERLLLKHEAEDFADRLHRPPVEVSLATVDALLVQLEAAGPDLG